MNKEPDLANRVAALEKLVGGRAHAKGPRVLLPAVGGLVLAALLTVNAWLTWRRVQALADSSVQRHFWVVCHRGATDEQRRDAFTELVKAGNHEWRSARLSHLKFRHGAFDGAQLELIDLESCDFTESTLVGANLRGANFLTAKLVRADLSYANLSEGFLRKADLTGSTVREANLQSASLHQADLKDADFEGADLSEADLSLAVLTDANLRNADLSWAHLDAADLCGANLDGANLENATIEDAFFAESNWWRAVGLTSDTIDRFKTEFAPSAEAKQEFQEDFAKWLKQYGSTP
jgi:uncharacterized protein YjbI with pentapeptide repeats